MDTTILFHQFYWAQYTYFYSCLGEAFQGTWDLIPRNKTNTSRVKCNVEDENEAE